jgi:sugar fermentation stimulation protein A
VGASKKRLTYILFVYLPGKRRIRVGRLGLTTFEDGLYLYVGSGGTSPFKRLARHAAKTKRKFWHIDYLTVHSKVIGAMIMESSISLECLLAGSLSDSFQAVAGFGSSDCACKSHLFLAEPSQEGHK